MITDIDAFDDAVTEALQFATPAAAAELRKQVKLITAELQHLQDKTEGVYYIHDLDGSGHVYGSYDNLRILHKRLQRHDMAEGFRRWSAEAHIFVGFVLGVSVAFLVSLY
jgi:hypothetical protein